MLRTFRVFSRLGHLPPMEEEQVQWTLSESLHLDVLCYKAKGKQKGCIIAVHGMSPEGAYDKRWVQLCRAYANLGYAVYAPTFPSISNLYIEANQIEQIQACIEHLYLKTKHPIGLLSVSFSGGICVQACEDDKVAQMIQSMMLIGSYFDVKSTMNVAVQADDPYAWQIVFANFAQLPKAVAACLLELAKDNYFKRTVPYWTKSHNLTENEFQLLEQILASAQVRASMWSDLSGDLQRDIEYFDPSSSYEKIKIPTFFLHGRRDHIIQAEQSLLAHQCLSQRCVPTAVEITDLLSHGDASSSRLKKLGSFWSLLTLIQKFLNHIKPPCTVQARLEVELISNGKPNAKLSQKLSLPKCI